MITKPPNLRHYCTNVTPGYVAYNLPLAFPLDPLRDCFWSACPRPNLNAGDTCLQIRLEMKVASQGATFVLQRIAAMNDVAS